MAPLRSLLCTLALATVANAFAPSNVRQFGAPAAPCVARRPSHFTPLFGLANPDTITETKTIVKEKQKQKEEVKVKTDDPVVDYEHEFKEAPMFLLFYIADLADEQEHVINRITGIIENVSEDEAAGIYKAGTSNGEAMLGKYPKEVAELYAEQLTRSTPIIYADVRDDKSSA